MILNKPLPDRSFYIFELVIILGSVFFPLLIDLPYRVNIFLSWEGAYRLYLGQVPYKDFGLPLGYGFFIIPFIFFKLLGPYLHSLVIAQVFINMASLFAFRNILKVLGVEPMQRAMAILVFCLSYSFFNFWPWYNHSVFVFQMVGFNFLLLCIFSQKKILPYLYLLLASFFIFLAFFTKQDSGGIAIVFAGVLLAYQCWVDKKKNPLFLAYICFITAIGFLVIGPLLPYGFKYWFNYGQAPHSSRLMAADFLNKILGGSNWEKLYLSVIALIFIWKAENFKEFINDRKEVLFLLITVGVICQAMIIKVTSPLPTDHYSYFHGFAFAYIFWNVRSSIPWNTTKYALSMVVLIFFWWSALYWDYFSRIFHLPSPQSAASTGISTNAPQQEAWTVSNYKSMAHVKMPPGSIRGIEKIQAMEVVKTTKDLKVLNMSELTPLAYELKYVPETGQPLWYHLNIGMFQKQVDEFCAKIKVQHYDLILYQDIPELPTFYPQEMKPCLYEFYEQVDKFEAPRKPSEGESFISVFIRKKSKQ